MEIDTQGYELDQEVVVITTGGARNTTRISGFAVFSRHDRDVVSAQVEIHDRWEGGVRNIWVPVSNLET